MTQIQCQAGMYRCTGTLLASVVISPDTGVLWTGIFCWENVTSGSFTVTVSNAAGSVVLPQGRRGLMWIDTVNAPRILAIAGTSEADSLPTGSNIPFFQASVPTGWTARAINDYAIRIVSNAGTGGSLAGSVNFSTLFGRTATDGFTLTTNEIPSHTHDVKYNFAADVATTGGGSRVTAILSTGSVTGSAGAAPTGGGNSHSHGIDMRVKYADVVIGQRD